MIRPGRMEKNEVTTALSNTLTARKAAPIYD